MSDAKEPVTLITGAADGIGWAMAKRYADGGHRVAIVDIDRDRAEERAAELGNGHFAFAADIAQESDVTAMVAGVAERCGRIDVLINNAGIGDSLLPTLEQNLATFERILHIHLSGTFLASREVVRVMMNSGTGGAIVNISSIAGVVGLPRRNAYGAAKAGIVSMTRSMACEWAGLGIRVNAIAPGYVGTELVHRLEQAGKIDMARLKRRIPLGRVADPMDIAEAAWFLSSPQAGYITGTTLTVDGGWAAFGDAGDAHVCG